MSSNLPLSEMTRAEKRVAIDQIWDDLMKNPDEIPTPYWHKQVLTARTERVENGEAQFQDWEEAKSKLRDEFK